MRAGLKCVQGKREHYGERGMCERERDTVSRTGFFSLLGPLGEIYTPSFTPSSTLNKLKLSMINYSLRRNPINFYFIFSLLEFILDCGLHESKRMRITLV